MWRAELNAPTHTSYPPTVPQLHLASNSTECSFPPFNFLLCHALRDFRPPVADTATQRRVVHINESLLNVDKGQTVYAYRFLGISSYLHCFQCVARTVQENP